MRPKTLAAVADCVVDGDAFDPCLANFLDGFYATPHAGALADPPQLLAPMYGRPGQVRDAYLAATAVEFFATAGAAWPTGRGATPAVPEPAAQSKPEWQ